jgi:signal transduction histidine kinase
MNKNFIQLSQEYVTTLEKHLKQGPQASFLPALQLGRRAVAFGLETLDLARMHEQALVTLQLSNTKNAFTKLAGIFFTEANAAIEETHRTARQSKEDLSTSMTALDRRTRELAASNRQLQRAVVRRKIMEDEFAKRGKRREKCLEESLELQNHLRHLAHRVLEAQEDERKKISHELQDEIAQTLLGINARLLSLKQQPLGNINGLKNEIATMQRLVVKSARSLRRFAYELNVHPQMTGSLRKLMIRPAGHSDENKNSKRVSR